MLVFNAHIHLNGSISKDYLKDTATKNGCSKHYDAFLAEKDPWKKFSWIHQIMQTTEDITRATVDVVEKSNADILEIRTTPKPIKDQGLKEYIQAFTQGLQKAKDLFPKKRARGLLSIDRTRHTLEDAKWIIEAALAEKKSSGMIVGIDLSGNFDGERKLTGNDLYLAIKYALERDIGLALHVGETDSKVEKQDFDLILKAIDEYQGKIRGKVRLGHAIYRTPEQDEIIKRRKIPVEICPSCHQQMQWWKHNEPHPILTLYQHRSNVIPGTDDDIIFECNAREEQSKLDKMLKVKEKYAALTEDEQHKKVSDKRKKFMF